MPSSRDLKGIAASLKGAFISRNNDIGGYWGIGLLCRDASISNHLVVLNLIERTASPATPSCVSAAGTFAKRLDTLLAHAGFSSAKITAASITMQFSSTDTKPWQSYRCMIALTTRGNHTYSVASEGSCKPHDPSQETKSARSRML